MAYIPVDSKLMELKPHGNYLFPVGVYHRPITEYGNGFLYYHWHNDLELFRLRGESACYCVGDKKFVLHDGDGIFVNSARIHMAKPLTSAKCVCNAIVFNPAIISGPTQGLIESKYISPILQNRAFDCLFLSPNEPWQNEILNRMEDVFTLDRDANFGYEYLIRSALCDIWYRILRNLPESMPHIRHFSAIQQQRLLMITDYIHQHYMEPLTLKQLADVANISPGECCKLFGKLLSTTPIQYLIDYRIGQSAQLLISTTLSITEVSETVGFNSTSHFAEVFRKHMKYSPMNYRKRLQTTVQQ